MNENTLNVPLSRGFVAIIDESDRDILVAAKWYANTMSSGTYAYGRINGRGKCVSLHRYLMDFPKGLFVDHINRNTLDNRRQNLRTCKLSSNVCNTDKWRDKPGTSQYVGVYFKEAVGKWISQIKVGGRQLFVKYSKDEYEAALATDSAIRFLRDKYAYLNFPDRSHIDHPEIAKKITRTLGEWRNASSTAYSRL